MNNETALHIAAVARHLGAEWKAECPPNDKGMVRITGLGLITDPLLLIAQLGLIAQAQIRLKALKTGIEKELEDLYR